MGIRTCIRLLMSISKASDPSGLLLPCLGVAVLLGSIGSFPRLLSYAINVDKKRNTNKENNKQGMSNKHRQSMILHELVLSDDGLLSKVITITSI